MPELNSDNYIMSKVTIICGLVIVNTIKSDEGILDLIHQGFESTKTELKRRCKVPKVKRKQKELLFFLIIFLQEHTLLVNYYKSP